MLLSDYDYNLPEELIAQNPPKERSLGRLLCLNKTNGCLEHKIIRDLPELLKPHDLLVFNDTKVIPARLFGYKSSGGKVEIMLERILNNDLILAQLRASKSLKIGTEIFINNNTKFIIAKKCDNFYELLLDKDSHQQNIDVLSILESHGHTPLPPYINRSANDVDKERYQTIFARSPGAVAAPTAALHFDHALVENISSKGVSIAHVTLHVGAGTFQPVRTENIQDHKMHYEYTEVNAETCAKIKETRQNNGRVIAVGTTSVRSLETVAQNGNIQPFHGETNIFIYPGYTFKCIDALITNFHLPKSTLMMLVSAFASREKILQAYQLAIQEHYRFFSYGDAMFIHK